jgi:uncharacterized protein YecE (DUF72 family)
MIRIGTAGWSLASAFRPAFPAEGTQLARYARVLTGVEINSSFYRSHRRDLYQRWASQTPRGFRFSVKMPREITHERRLRAAKTPLTAFLAEVAGLGSRLGPLLAQLPPSLPCEMRAARRFFALVRENHAGPVVCEPRHASWFTRTADRLFLDFGVGRVAADPAIVADAAQPAGDLETTYFRLHGSPRIYWSRYTPEQISILGARLRRWSAESRVWCIFDNTVAHGALANALELSVGLRGARTSPVSSSVD